MILWLLILWTSLYKRGSLQQQSRAYVQGKAGTQSSYLTFHWSSFVLRISRSPGMWREGSPAEQWDGGYFLTTALMAPKDLKSMLAHPRPPKMSGSCTDGEPETGNCFPAAKSPTLPRNLPVVALQEEKLCFPRWQLISAQWQPAWNTRAWFSEGGRLNTGWK